MMNLRRHLPAAGGLLLWIVLVALPAWSDDIISFKKSATTPHDLLFNTIDVNTGSVIRVDPPAELVDDEALFGAIDEDIDALHYKKDGNYLISVNGSATIDGVFYLAGDIVEFSPSTGTATQFFDGGDVFGSTAVNVDALYLIESGPDAGQLILSTAGNATIGGLAMGAGDLVQYDPLTDTATLFFDQDNISGTLGQRGIDALHVTPIGDLIISVTTTGGSLGGVTLESTDLVQHTPGGSSTLYLDGEGLFDGETASLDAVGSVPSAVPVLDPSGLVVVMTLLTLTTLWVWRSRERAHAGTGD